MHKGVRVLRLWAPIRISRGFLMPTYPWRIFQLLRQHDIVNIHVPAAGNGAGDCAGAAGGRVGHRDASRRFDPARRGRFNSFITRTMFALYKYMARRIPKLVGYSHDYADHSYYLQPFRDKVQIIYPPIQIPEPQPDRAAQYRRDWQHEGGPVIGFSGRFVQEKRPDLLIRALDVINCQYPMRASSSPASTIFPTKAPGSGIWRW